MRCIIPAAGSGSRMGDHCPEGEPKLFMNIGDRQIYDHILDRLPDQIDVITVVLGHGYERANRSEIRGQIERDESFDYEINLFRDWIDWENASSVMRALEEDDTMIHNGDVIVDRSILNQLTRDMDHDGRVLVTDEWQSKETAVKTKEGMVEDYGILDGWRHAGVSIVREESILEYREILRQNQDRWYPIAYPMMDMGVMKISASEHCEFNRPEDITQTIPS